MWTRDVDDSASSCLVIDAVNIEGRSQRADVLRGLLCGIQVRGRLSHRGWIDEGIIRGESGGGCELGTQ